MKQLSFGATLILLALFFYPNELRELVGDRYLEVTWNGQVYEVGVISPPGTQQEMQTGVAPAIAVGDPYDMRLLQPPSVTPQQIDEVLASYGSPATGTGQYFYDKGLEWGIDPAFALAFFIKESSAGTAGAAVENKSIGNIICTAGWPRCGGRFRAYDSWEQGIDDWYRLIAVEYIDGRGHQTPADVIPVYAPSVENDTGAYIEQVQAMVAGWREQNLSAMQTYVEPVGEAQVEVQTPALPANVQGVVEAPPLTLDGFGVYTPACIEKNVLNSLLASPGLQSVTIPPGADWSFNENWRDPGTMTNECYGVLGSGVCDLASRPHYIARHLGLSVQTTDHGIQLANMPREDATAIWGQPGVRGGQDVIVTNTSGHTLRIVAQVEGDAITFRGWLE